MLIWMVQTNRCINTGMPEKEVTHIVTDFQGGID